MRRPGRIKRAPRGLTLIELVVAMAIFGLVAVMGLQALTGSLRLDRALGARAETAQAVSQAAALLRHDLEGVQPMLFFPPGSARGLSALRADPGGQGWQMSVGNRSRAEDTAPGYGRVVWRLTGDGVLTRAVWPGLTPHDSTAPPHAVTVLGDVRGVALRTFWTGIGWVAGTQPVAGGTVIAPPSGPGGADSDEAGSVERYSSVLPGAVEITLTLGDGTTLQLVEALP